MHRSLCMHIHAKDYQKLELGKVKVQKECYIDCGSQGEQNYQVLPAAEDFSKSPSARQITAIAS